MEIPRRVCSVWWRIPTGYPQVFQGRPVGRKVANLADSVAMAGRVVRLTAGRAGGGGGSVWRGRELAAWVREATLGGVGEAGRFRGRGRTGWGPARRPLGTWGGSGVRTLAKTAGHVDRARLPVQLRQGATEKPGRSRRPTSTRARRRRRPGPGSVGPAFPWPR